MTGVPFHDVPHGPTADGPPGSAASGSARPDRRGLLAGAASALVWSMPGWAEAATRGTGRDYAGPLPAHPDAGPPPGGRSRPMLRGTRRPSYDETAVAARIVAATPRTAPLAIMLHLESLHTLNRDGEAYNAGWRTRWNPVIVDFFRRTGTKPSGDTTAWCAASLNWALARCGYAGGTGSASSGSFRSVRGRTRHPRPGDVAVFGASDPAAFARGQGHVGLFLAETADHVLVLGGNQKNGAGHQAVCRKWLAKRDGERRLLSYHAVGALRSAA